MNHMHHPNQQQVVKMSWMPMSEILEVCGTPATHDPQFKEMKAMKLDLEKRFAALQAQMEAKDQVHTEKMKR